MQDRLQCSHVELCHPICSVPVQWMRGKITIDSSWPHKLLVIETLSESPRLRDQYLGQRSFPPPNPVERAGCRWEVLDKNSSIWTLLLGTVSLDNEVYVTAHSLFAANSRTNTERIQNVENCFGHSGQVSFGIVLCSAAKLSRAIFPNESAFSLAKCRTRSIWCSSISSYVLFEATSTCKTFGNDFEMSHFCEVGGFFCSWWKRLFRKINNHPSMRLRDLARQFIQRRSRCKVYLLS